MNRFIPNFVKAWLSVYLAFKNNSPTFKNPSIQSLENNSLDNPCDLEDSIGFQIAPHLGTEHTSSLSPWLPQYQGGSRVEDI